MTLKVQITKEEISSPKQKSRTDTPNHLKQNKTKRTTTTTTTKRYRTTEASVIHPLALFKGEKY